MIADYAEDREVPRLLTMLRAWAPVVLCGLVGFLSAFTVSVVGQLPVGELILVAIFPWVLLRAFVNCGWTTRLQQLGWYKLLLFLVGLMAAGYVASDLYRGTSGSNLARGWARVGFLAIDLVVVAYLIENSWKRLYVFVFALYVGGSLNAMLAGPLFDEWWKFGVGYTITSLLLFAVAGRAPAVQVLAGVALGALSFGLGARSLGSICLLTAGLLWLRYAHGVLRVVALATTLGAMAAMFSAANAVFIENQDHLGSNLERQSMIETAGEAFLSSPFIGQGSWFTATQLISHLEEKRMRKDPSFHGYSEDEARQISIHSQLLVSLAEGGILGGLFFIGLGFLLLKTLRTLVTSPMPHRAFLFYLVVAGLWNLCMSPFSGVARVEIALAICACLLVILQRQGELPEDYRE